MDKTIQSIGIIGLGSFGYFFASKLPQNIRVVGYDPNEELVTTIPRVSLETAASCDIVMLAVPLTSLADVLREIKPILKPESLLFEICSVKIEPERLIAEILPEHQNVLITHPLFGPQSAAHSMQGHRLIVTKQVGKKAELFLNYCRDALGLNVIPLSADEHDRAMAKVHALTFFIARGLANMELTPSGLDTPSYDYVLDLVQLDASQSEELFKTISVGNPYAHEARQGFLDELDRIHKSL